MTSQEAAKEIAKLVQQAYDAINAAEAIADEHKLSFSFGVAYGMGGTYQGDPEERYSEYGDEPEGWHASSQSC